MELMLNDMLENCGLARFPDEYDAGVYQDVYDDAYDAFRASGATEAEAALSAATAAEMEEYERQREAYDEWLERADETFQHICRGLSMRCLITADSVQLDPIEGNTWRDVAEEMRQLVNGVGYFHFSSLTEFLDSGPYEPEDAVRLHLHYLRRYKEVYGG